MVIHQLLYTLKSYKSPGLPSLRAPRCRGCRLVSEPLPPTVYITLWTGYRSARVRRAHYTNSTQPSGWICCHEFTTLTVMHGLHYCHRIYFLVDGAMLLALLRVHSSCRHPLPAAVLCVRRYMSIRRIVSKRSIRVIHYHLLSSLL